MPETPRKRPARGGRAVRNRRRLIVAAAALILVAAGVGATLAASGGDGDGAPGAVHVNGVDVSGMERAEIADVVREQAKELESEQIVITRSDKPGFKVAATRSELGAKPRVKATVDEALEPRNLGGRILTTLGIAPTRDVAITWTLDRGKVATLVEQVTGRVNDPAVSAKLKVTADDIVATRAKAGYGIDPRALQQQIADGETDIEVTPGPLEPGISDAEAAEARQEALTLIAQPVPITFQGRSVPIETDVLREALRFKEQAPDLRVTLDPDTLYDDIKDAFSTREVEARDAAFRVSGSSVRLIPSRAGRALDMRAIVDEIVAAPGTPVRARFKVSQPEVLTAELSGLGIKEEISEFTTPYNCCEPRVTNIQRAAAILDGMIIPAGGRFSLNEALGQRTLDRGFVEAPQIAAGRLEDAVGGGVSQVATTMYNAAFFGGMELVAHTPHQFWISRYPPGREATVSFGGPELIWVNNWDAAVLISASAGSNSVTIKLFSSKLGRAVSTETGPKTDIVEPKEVETVNPELAPGAREVKQEMGGPGFTITYTRTITVDGKVTRDEDFSWTYDPQDAYIEVGPEEEKPKGGSGGTGTTTTPDEPETTSPEPSQPETQPTTSQPADSSDDGGSQPPPG